MSNPGALREAVSGVIGQQSGLQPDCNTGGGTSDDRFIAPLGTEVLELGLTNRSIHKVDEHCPVGELEGLVQLYRGVMQRLLPA
mgnify:FL=1